MKIYSDMQINCNLEIQNVDARSSMYLDLRHKSSVIEYKNVYLLAETCGYNILPLSYTGES